MYYDDRFVSSGGIQYLVSWLNEYYNLYNTTKTQSIDDTTIEVLCNLINGIIVLPITAQYILNNNTMLDIFHRLSKLSSIPSSISDSADNLYTHWKLIAENSKKIQLHVDTNAISSDSNGPVRFVNFYLMHCTIQHNTIQYYTILCYAIFYC